jgi:hypothetical protein
VWAALSWVGGKIYDSFIEFTRHPPRRISIQHCKMLIPTTGHGGPSLASRLREVDRCRIVHTDFREHDFYELR